MIKKILILLLVILLAVVAGLTWFFNRSTVPSADALAFTTEPILAKTDSESTTDYNENRNAYFGDLHIHTSWSFDAFIFNVRSGPEEAYRYGKGETITHVTGKPIKMKRPLDFMAVSDHAEYMGILTKMKDSNHPLAQLDIAKRLNSKDEEESKKAFGDLGMAIALNWPDRDLIQADIVQSTWQKNVEIADAHYEPGKFTTFPAYEWTCSLVKYFNWPQYAQNLHRNIIYKGGKVSGVPFASFDSQNPEELWKWMDKERSKGIELLAIPHNGNISDGKMYATETFHGDAIDKAYAESRMRNEPINEVSQIKGTSMTHPALAKNDEFADFEIYEHSLGRTDPRKKPNVKNSYVREAMKNGLLLEESVGANPFKFGFIGSTDSHNGATNVEEDNNIGKMGAQDMTPELRMKEGDIRLRTQESSVGGLAGVWAKENTRTAIFEAMERKEVFATSGTRLKVRFFATWMPDTTRFEQENWLDQLYESGVAMGGDLTQRPASVSKAPTFYIQAIKDAEGANLDRIQVIKGWIAEDGRAQEKVFEVAWSGERTKDANGKLPAVGNTVDINTATYTNTIGAVNLQAIWSDPEFDVDTKAFYYVRVLEIPTPRWTTRDAAKLGVEVPKDIPTTIQERAWTSPIWYGTFKK